MTGRDRLKPLKLHGKVGMSRPVTASRRPKNFLNSYLQSLDPHSRRHSKKVVTVVTVVTALVPQGLATSRPRHNPSQPHRWEAAP